MAKLVIQIPCYNEEDTLPTTLNDLPKTVDGFDEVEVLVVNDGSTDKSRVIAIKHGAKVLDIKPNKGLANAFRSGLQEALSLGADVIVNTDADNQYSAGDIGKLTLPILESQADIVVGARNISKINDFSLLKKLLQKIGSAVLRLLSATKVEDAPSGFRAFSREAALKLNVFDNYSYTMETLVQAGAKGLRVASVPIEVNPKLRESRLVKNIFDYVFKSAKTTVRMFIVYRPFRFFAIFSVMFAIIGLFLVGRFLYYYLMGDGNGHIQSLIFSAIFLIASVQFVIIAIVGDLLSINRRLLEDIQTRLKNIELKK